MASLPPMMPPVSAPPMLPAMPMSAPQSPMGMDLGDYQADLPLDMTPKDESVIEKLRPGSELHARVIGKLQAMFKFSADEMRKHHPRWNVMEHKIQAYMRMPDYKELEKHLNNQRALPPEPVKVIVPYSYATLHAAATFLASVLVGRKPIFPLMAKGGSTVENARFMEQGLQSQIEASKGYEVLWQMIWDSLTVSFGAVRIGWEERYGMAMRLAGGQRQTVQELKYAGNKLQSIDPYAFFPDPRVPLWEVNTKGDFVFWESEQSQITLRQAERDGMLKWVDEAVKGGTGRMAGEQTAGTGLSQRRARIGTSGEWLPTPQNIVGFAAVREGTVRLVPKDWGLRDSQDSELWKFTFTRHQIIQAEPLGMIHERHPVAVTEPTSFGYEFNSLSMADMISPFQDLISWLINSRMENVRTTINNQWIADPARVEIGDIRSSAAGRVIRMKQAAVGLPINDAIRQLVVQDVTQGHIGDVQMLRTLADTITGVNDNMRGVQTAGGRRSATEARMSMQAGASRLSQMAVRMSSQGFLDLAEQMIMNTQQFMPDEMWAAVTGDDGKPSSRLLTPDMLLGSFNYQVSDGSLPFDKMALLDVWKEILMGVAQDPELRQQYDVDQIFEYVAQLSGAKNISNFKKAAMMPPPGQPMLGDPAMLQQQAGAGELMPMGAAQAPMPAGAFR